MSDSQTTSLAPAEIVLRAARTIIEREQAALKAASATPDKDDQRSLQFRSDFLDFLEEQIRGGAEADDVIVSASLVGAFMRGVLTAASCASCPGCASEAASELAGMLIAGAGIDANAGVVLKMRASGTAPVTKH